METRWHARELAYPVLAPIVSALGRLVARIRVRGSHHIPRNGPALVLPNHVSHLDPVVLLTVLWSVGRRPRFAAVSGLWSVPVVGWLLRVGRMIPVTRGAGPERFASEAAVALAAEQLLVVYPEGTIVEPGAGRPARPGAGLLALSTSAPAIPVAIDGLEPWEGGIPRLRQDVTVTVGPPMDLSAFDASEGRDAWISASSAVLDRIHDLRGDLDPRRPRAG